MKYILCVTVTQLEPQIYLHLEYFTTQLYCTFSQIKADVMFSVITYSWAGLNLSQVSFIV